MLSRVDLRSVRGLARPAAVAAAMALAGAAEWRVPASETDWRYIVQHLYYFPIVYAGLRFGWKSGLAAGLVAGLTSLMHGHGLSQYLQIGIYGAAGALSGVLAERERRKRRASEETVERMKRAERLSALGQLSAGLAHEIRNPLASIAGAVGILRRGRSSDAKQAECLEIIQKECQRLNRLLTSFLDFARPRSLNFRTVQVESVFESVLGLAARNNADGGMTFSVQLPLRRRSKT